MRKISLFLSIFVITFSIFHLPHLDSLYAVETIISQRDPSPTPLPQGEGARGRVKRVFSGEKLNLNETKLATIPEDYQSLQILFSANGQKVAYKAIKQGKHFVVVNDKAGKFYEAINDPIVLSPDGKKVAYHGKRGGKEYLVINGKEVKSYDDVAPAAFGPDSRLLACEVEEKKKWFIVVSDGEKEVHRSPAYPRSLRSPVFSPNGRLLVYELGEDNKRIVFFIDFLTKRIIKERLYDDFDMAGKFSFSSDSSRLIYEVRKGDKVFLVLQDFVLNEERRIEFPYAWTGMFAFSPDGEKITYLVSKGGKYFLGISPWESPAQGKEKAPYEGIATVIFSPDSRIVAYVAVENGKWRIVVGDKEGRGYDAIGDATVFSPDGSKIAYPAVKDGKWVMVFSSVGKPTAVKEGPAYDMVITPVFSPDGRRLIYRARRGQGDRFIVVANAETGKVIKEGPVCDEVWPPVFSADGKSAAYGARIGRELWWKVHAIP